MIRSARTRLVRAWLLTGVIDGLFSSVLSVAFYHSTVARLFFTVRWWIQLIGHIPFVGVPIVWSISRGARHSATGA